MKVKIFKNKLVVMDYVNDTIHFIDTDLEDSDRIEDYLSKVGFDLGNVEWIKRKQITINY